MATLVAGDFVGVYVGYYQPAPIGSLSAEIFPAGTTVLLVTGYTANRISAAVSGDQTASLTSLTHIKVDGVDYALTSGPTYVSGNDATDVEFGPYAGFTIGNSYSVELVFSGGGDTTPPTITSSSTASVAENVTLAHALTANESVTWSIVGGADQSKFEISGSTLRWASNGTKDYDAPDDADTNNTYVVTVRATDAASNTTDQTITVTVTEGYEGPSWIGKSTALGSTSSGNIDFTSSGRASGDKLFIAIASANQAIATPSDFTEVANSPQSRGTAAAAGGIRLAVFQKTSDGTETTVSIADPGNHVYAIGFVIRPKSGESIVIDTSAGKNAAAGTAHSGNSLTTTVPDCLIVDVWATDRDSAGPSYSAEANASLTALTERHDAGTTSGVGSGIVIYTGGKIAAGAVSATTATSAASVAYCAITLALKSAVAASGVDGTSSGTVSLTGAGAGKIRVAGAGSGAITLAGAAAGLALAKAAASGAIDLGGAAQARADLTAAAAGSIAFAGTAAGKADVAGASAGDFGLSGSAQAGVRIAAAGSGEFGLTGDAQVALGAGAVSSGALAITGEAEAAVRIAGTVAGTFGLTGEAQAALPAVGASAGTIGLTGGAQAALRVAGASAGELGLSGASAGVVALVAASGGTLPLSGDAAGRIALVASSAGTLPLSGAAVVAIGSVPLTGSAAGGLDMTGTAQAKAAVSAASAGAMSFAGLGAGEVTISGAAAGNIGFAGTAEAGVDVVGSAAGSIALSGGATGSTISAGLSGAGTLALTGISTGTARFHRSATVLRPAPTPSQRAGQTYPARPAAGSVARIVTAAPSRPRAVSGGRR